MPENCCSPKIENNMIIKAIKMVALPNSGSDLRSVLTNFLILGIALIDLRGLTTLNILNALRFNFTRMRSMILYNGNLY